MNCKAVADAHCDVLYRMQGNKIHDFRDDRLSAGLHELCAGQVKTQVFALFVTPDASSTAQLARVLQQIDIYDTCVARTFAAHDSQPHVEPVTSRSTLERVRTDHNIAGLLSLEGGGCLCGDPALLRILFRLGVRGIGLTWNPANELADGCREPRGGPLTKAGVAVAAEAWRQGMWVDIAHLSDHGVDELFTLGEGALMASHANCRRIHDHPRNLRDESIRELICRDGWIGLTFEASFVKSGSAVPDDVFRHLEHVLELGGEHHVGFGSDFDGTSHNIPGLSRASDYSGMAEALVKRYGHRIANAILFDNFETFLGRVLPA